MLLLLEYWIPWCACLELHVYVKRLPLIKNDNFWQCSVWCTIEELFVFCGKVMLFLRYCFLLFQTIPSPSRVVTSCWVEYTFEYVFWIIHQLVMKFTEITDKVMANFCQKYFAWLGELNPEFRPFLIYQHTTFIRTPIMVSLCILTLWKVSTQIIKNKQHHLKTNRSNYTVIETKS